MCVIVVTIRGWADVGLWVAVCFLAKISLHRPACKTPFARLIQSQAISKSFRVFITLRSIRGTTFFHFSKLFFIPNYRFLYHGDQKISWEESAGGGRSTSKSTCEVPAWSSDCIWRSISIQYVQIEPGMNSDLGNGSLRPFGWKSVALSM